MTKEFDEWVDTHCYDCGGLTTEPGPRDVDHILCFVGMEDLTPEQRAKVTPVYTVEQRPRWQQEGFVDIHSWVRHLVDQD